MTHNWRRCGITIQALSLKNHQSGFVLFLYFVCLFFGLRSSISSFCQTAFFYFASHCNDLNKEHLHRQIQSHCTIPIPQRWEWKSNADSLNLVIDQTFSSIRIEALRLGSIIRPAMLVFLWPYCCDSSAWSDGAKKAEIWHVLCDDTGHLLQLF